MVASRLMFDTFAASQSDGIEAKNLLITHFAFDRKYPEPRVRGICDAIKSLINGSFLRLQLLAFDVLDLHLQQFGRQLISEFDGLSEI